jgi:hypothetical protein
VIRSAEVIAVSQRLVDMLLREIAPDLTVTRDLCQGCAPSGNEVAQVLDSLPTDDCPLPAPLAFRSNN